MISTVDCITRRVKMSVATKLVAFSFLALVVNATRAQDSPTAMQGTQQPKPLRGRLSLAAKDWGVLLDLPGFTVKIVETKPDGRRYMVAENETTNVVVSLTLEAVKAGARASSCRKSLEEKTKITEVKIRDVRFSRTDD